MRDVTALIAGDPGTSPRREPTQGERKHSRPFHKVLGDQERLGMPYKSSPRNKERCAFLAKMEVGESIAALTKSDACAILNWFRRRGVVASCKTQPDRSFIITKAAP